MDLESTNSGIEVGKGRRRRRVGEVVCRHVDRLHRGDRTILGGGDALLQITHFGGQCGLVTDGARHPAQQCRDLGTRLSEPEDVVNEEKYVLTLNVTEVLRHGEPR